MNALRLAAAWKENTGFPIVIVGFLLHCRFNDKTTGCLTVSVVAPQNEWRETYRLLPRTVNWDLGFPPKVIVTMKGEEVVEFARATKSKKKQEMKSVYASDETLTIMGAVSVSIALHSGPLQYSTRIT